MIIQVFGSGCANCKKLFELTKEAVKELELKTEVEYISDAQKIVELGVMSSPVLAIDGKAIISGSVPSLQKIKEAIIGSTSQSNSCQNCSCGGKC